MTAWIISEEVKDNLKRLFREAVGAELANMMNGELLNLSEAATLLSMARGRCAKRRSEGNSPAFVWTAGCGSGARNFWRWALLGREAGGVCVMLLLRHGFSLWSSLVHL